MLQTKPAFQRSSDIKAQRITQVPGSCLSASRRPFNHRVVWPSRHSPAPQRYARLTRCNATLDDPEFKDLLAQLRQQRPAPSSDRTLLQRAFDIIDAANSGDPRTAEGQPYRQAYGRWLTDWVRKLDPGASDELLLLARGKNIEGWKLANIRRDDYAPNTGGQKQWEADRRRWQADRLAEAVAQAGYPSSSADLVRDFLLGRDIPDPRDIRRYDVTAPLGSVDWRTLELAAMAQTLQDAEALLLLEKNFEAMFNSLPGDEVVAQLKAQLAGVSEAAQLALLNMGWPPLARKMLVRALPLPARFNDLMLVAEGRTAASTHPGDWRYRDFDYE